MILPVPGRIHLTYCTNIHPARTLEQIRQNIADHVVEVKKRIAPDRPFGLGLWIPNIAANDLSDGQNLARFKDWLSEKDLYVFTLNGFPYGDFHARVVKERVYSPDWRQKERLDYTCALARILSVLLPDDDATEGSISTLPLAFRRNANPGMDIDHMAQALAKCALELHEIKAKTGKTISVNLEPEPFCLLESAKETAGFFAQNIFCGPAVKTVAEGAGAGLSEAEEILRRHLGVCWDACHSAVNFEDPGEVFRVFDETGVRIGKVQISAGLRIPMLTKEAIAEVRPFAEGTYLHQVTEKRGADLRRYVDLPDALAANPIENPDKEWRIHFHVPIYREAPPPLGGTRDYLMKLLELVRTRSICSHLEVETYTWEVLPQSWRGDNVVESVVRELQWVRERMSP
jgi:hypothetical protein